MDLRRFTFFKDFKKRQDKFKKKRSNEKCKICKQSMEVNGYSAYPRICKKCLNL